MTCLLSLCDHQQHSMYVVEWEGEPAEEQTPPCPRDIHATPLCQRYLSPICHDVSSCWGPGIHRGCSTCRPIYLGSGSTDVFDSSICYPTKQGPHSSKPRKEESGTEQDWDSNGRNLPKKAAAHLMEMRRAIRQFGKSKPHALPSGGWLKQQKVCVYACVHVCVGGVHMCVLVCVCKERLCHHSVTIR